MLTTFIRTLILYLVAVIFARLIGKRQIAQLQPFEWVLALMVADLATAPMSDIGIPILYGISSIVVLLFIHACISFLALKCEWFRHLLCGKPSLLVDNGQLRREEMTRLRYNLNDLLEQLRDKSVVNIQDIEAAILETSGKVSVILKPEKNAVTLEDLRLPAEEKGIPIALICDGKIHKKNLQACGKDQDWLMLSLKKLGYASPKQIFFCTLDKQDNLTVYPKEE